MLFNSLEDSPHQENNEGKRQDEEAKKKADDAKDQRYKGAHGFGFLVVYGVERSAARGHLQRLFCSSLARWMMISRAKSEKFW